MYRKSKKKARKGTREEKEEEREVFTFGWGRGGLETLKPLFGSAVGSLVFCLLVTSTVNLFQFQSRQCL